MHHTCLRTLLSTLALILALPVVVHAKRAVPPFTAAQLRGARRVTVKPFYGDHRGREVTVTNRKTIKRLVRQMRFKPVRRCRCKLKYELTFLLKDDKKAVVLSWPHGWRFDGESVSQRDDNKEHFTRFLDRLVARELSKTKKPKARGR